MSPPAFGSAPQAARSAPNSKQSSTEFNCAGNFRILRADAGNPSNFRTIASTRGGVTKGTIHLDVDGIVLRQRLSLAMGALMFLVSWIGILFLMFLTMSFFTKPGSLPDAGVTWLALIIAILIPVFVARRMRRFERRLLFSNIIRADIGSSDVEIGFGSTAKSDSTGTARGEQPLPAFEKVYFSPYRAEHVAGIGRALATAGVGINDSGTVEKSNFLKRLNAATPIAWVTPALLAINVCVFVLMSVSDSQALLTPPIPMLLRWGADYGPLTVTDRQWWRLLTGCFVHIGFWHLCFNMVALWQAGRIVERLFGNWFFLAVYLGCGLVGSLTSLYFQPDLVSAGASGAIFGVYGALLGFIARQREALPGSMAGNLVKVGVTFVGYNLVYGLLNYFEQAADRITQNAGSHGPHIDLACHAGGLVAGLVFGFMAARPLDLGPRRSTAAPRSIALAASLLVLAALLLVPVMASGHHKTANFLKLAAMYYRGDGVAKNPEISVRWFSRAAEQGNLSAENMLGSMFYRGDGVKQDAGKAVQWFIKAGEAGDVNAESLLVRIYFTGQGVATNYAEGIKWLTKLANQGADQDFNELEKALANAYSQGVDGLPKNEEAAVKWLTRVADRGDIQAKNQLKRGIHEDMAEAYYKSGGTKLRSKDLDGAIVDYGKAIELKPDDAEAYNYRGVAELEKNDWARAIADFNKFIELNPNDAHAYNYRAFVKIRQGDVDGAIADYTRAIELKPDDVEAHGNRGYAKLQKGDLNGAIADCTRAIELKPDDAYAYTFRGEAKKAKGDFDGAIADYTKVIELKPDLAANYLNRGLAMQAKDNFEGAIADFTEAIELKPGYFYAYNNRGVAKQAKGDLDGAIADCTKAIQLNSTFGYAYGSRGWARYGKGEITPALEDFKKAVELQDRKSSAASEDQGMIDFINGDYGKAVASWEAAVQKDGLTMRKLQPWIEKAEAKQNGK
jgi:tetratricopeptide (TPR) repeat protein/membrane associated rhomboid family serine protease